MPLKKRYPGQRSNKDRNQGGRHFNKNSELQKVGTNTFELIEQPNNSLDCSCSIYSDQVEQGLKFCKNFLILKLKIVFYSFLKMRVCFCRCLLLVIRKIAVHLKVEIFAILFLNNYIGKGPKFLKYFGRSS